MLCRYNIRVGACVCRYHGQQQFCWLMAPYHVVAQAFNGVGHLFFFSSEDISRKLIFFRIIPVSFKGSKSGDLSLALELTTGNAGL
jgi:hypothetical protein